MKTSTKSASNSLSSKIKKGLTDKGITTRSLVAFLIFGMIVLVFVLSDLTGRNKGSMSMSSAAEVNVELISIKEFQDEENRLAQYYSQMFGGQFDSDQQRNMLRGEVMNTLVTKSIAAQAAEKEGIFATDAEVRNMITQELPYFKKDGVFQPDSYKAILQANKMNPSEFESKLRQDIKNQRSRGLFESSLSVTSLQKNIENELKSAKINLEFIQISAVEFAKNNLVNDQQIASSLALPAFKKQVEDNFKTNQAMYEKPEQVRAAHILIKTTLDTEAAARKSAEAILKRTEKENFEKLAAQLSEDVGSKIKNGDLGYFSKGQMVKEFEAVAFNLPVGQISGLVKTQFGYHIIKVTDKKAAAKANLEAVQNEIAKKIISDEKFLTFTKSIETDLSSGKQTEAVNQLLAANLNWKETGYFDLATEMAPQINSSLAIKIGLSLTKEKPMHNKLVRAGDSQYLIKLKDIKTETVDIKTQDQEILARKKPMEAYQAWVESFKKSAKIETNTGLTNPVQ